jgi:WD40 repeat protein
MQPVTPSSNPPLNPHSFAGLPPDLLLTIFSRVVLREDLPALYFVNKQFNSLISESNTLWNVIFKRFFPEIGMRVIAGPKDAMKYYRETCHVRDCVEIGYHHSIVMTGVSDFTYIDLDLNDETFITAHSTRNLAFWGKDWEQKGAPDTQWDLNLKESLDKDKAFKMGIRWNGQTDFYPNVKAMKKYKDRLFVTTKVDGYTLSTDSIIIVCDLNLKTQKTCLNDHKKKVNCLLGIENKLYSGSADKSIKVWDMEKCKLLQTLEGHEYPVSFLTNDWDYLYSASEEGEVLQWNLKDGKKSSLDFVKKAILNKTTKLSAIHIHGNHLVCGDSSGKIIVWDVTRRIQLDQFCGHENAICSLTTFSNLLFSSSYSTESAKVTISNLSTGEPIYDFLIDNDRYPVSPDCKLKWRSGVLYAMCGNTFQTFDFVRPIRHERTLLNKIKSTSAKEELTKLHTELLHLALIQKDRKKIIKHVDALLACDPKNAEFYELLVVSEAGMSDPRGGLVSLATFDETKQALDKFIEKLKVDRNIQVEVAPFRIPDEDDASSEESGDEPMEISEDE